MTIEECRKELKELGWKVTQIVDLSLVEDTNCMFLISADATSPEYPGIIIKSLHGKGDTATETSSDLPAARERLVKFIKRIASGE